MNRKYILLLLTLVLCLPISAQTKKTTTAKKQSTSKTISKNAVKSKAQLQKEKAALEKQRKAAAQKAAALNKHIKSNLDSVLILDNKIGKQKVAIDSLNTEVKVLNDTIDSLSGELGRLQKELDIKKKRFAKAVVYMRRNRSAQEKLMFVFSADNFSQIVRRYRYMKEYSTFQRAQGELLKEKQMEVTNTQNNLLNAKTKVENNLVNLRERKHLLEVMKSSCEEQVSFLNKNLSVVQKQIQDYQKKEQSLNAEIERIIQIELEAARKAEAERNRKAEEAAREKARKLAEAKAAKAEAEAAKKTAKTAKEKAAAKAALEKANADLKEAEAEDKLERKKMEEWKSSSADVKLSGNFANNQGKLPMPITGSYSVVGHYGTYNVAGLKNVTLENKGIDIKGQEGCSARAVFDGEVSSVFQYGGRYVVMLRHGSYISIYSGLSSVAVSKGQKVKTRESLGTIGKDTDGRYVLQFQLRKERTRLNPEQWVR